MKMCRGVVRIKRNRFPEMRDGLIGRLVKHGQQKTDAIFRSSRLRLGFRRLGQSLERILLVSLADRLLGSRRPVRSGLRLQQHGSSKTQQADSDSFHSMHIIGVGECMRRNVLFLIAALLLPVTLSADNLGFVEQKFSYIHFENGKWARTEQLPCYVYTAQQDGATVNVLRIGASNLVPFRATKGLKVTICGSVAAFDEGFETNMPQPTGGMGRPMH